MIKKQNVVIYSYFSQFQRRSVRMLNNALKSIVFKVFNVLLYRKSMCTWMKTSWTASLILPSAFFLALIFSVPPHNQWEQRHVLDPLGLTPPHPQICGQSGCREQTEQNICGAPHHPLPLFVMSELRRCFVTVADQMFSTSTRSECHISAPWPLTLKPACGRHVRNFKRDSWVGAAGLK